MQICPSTAALAVCWQGGRAGSNFANCGRAEQVNPSMTASADCVSVLEQPSSNAATIRRDAARDLARVCAALCTMHLHEYPWKPLCVCVCVVQARCVCGGASQLLV